MKKRVITAVVLLLVLALVIWQINTPVLLFAVAFISGVATGEILKCANVQNKVIQTLAINFSIGIQFFASENVLEPLVHSDFWSKIINFIPPIVYIIALVLLMFLAMLKGYLYTTFEDVAVSIVAGVIVPYGLSIFIRLRDMFENEQFGIYLIFFALICALGTDSGAQLSGMAFGKHKMSPNISPKKTIEGAVGGIIVSLILNAVAIVIYNKVANVPIDEYAFTVLMICALPISILSMMGDLTASVLKRNFDVKDFGNIFPGHGGVMDRFDSSLFTLPATYAVAITLLS